MGGDGGNTTGETQAIMCFLGRKEAQVIKEQAILA